MRDQGAAPPEDHRPGEEPSRLEELVSLVARNERHQDRLAEVETRISVTGTRGKSTLARWLHNHLVERDYDTYAKITGDEPLSMYNGTEWLIPRSDRVTLYENEREIKRFFPMDAMVVENQGIRPYTTRLVNTRYVDPTHVVVPNIREDHLDTLGGNRERITRAIARSIPEGGRVICAEQVEPVRRYIAEELDERDAVVTYVDVPEEFAHIPGAELVYCLDETLRAVDGSGIDRATAEAYLADFRVEWRHLPAGRVYDASSVNDVQSTEAFRRALVAGTDETVQPLIYLRRDRPGRTASYARYMNVLAARDEIQLVRVVDGHAEAFAARTDPPVRIHDPSEDPESVLADALVYGWPVVLMGNATPEFMVELRRVIDEKTVEAPGPPGPQPLATTSLGTVAETAEQVLVLHRDPIETTTGICSDLLTIDSHDAAVVVALERSIQDHLGEWEYRPSTALPDQLAVVGVGDPTRSAAATTPEPLPTGPDAEVFGPITAVELPTLASGLAETVADMEAPSASTAVCIDSLNGLLAERGPEDTFKIIDILNRQLADLGVTVHYHLSTVGLDHQTIGTLRPLFDVVITVNEQGDSWVKF